MNRAWIAVAYAEHVRRGRESGVMQVNHGKAAPLRRVQPGDGVVYYSPTLALGSKVPYRAFTAAGVVEAGEPYLFDMGGGFKPWRRDVMWWPTEDLPVTSVLSHLKFPAGRRNWTSGLRFGLMAISCADFNVIREAMRGPDRPHDL